MNHQEVLCLPFNAITIAGIDSHNSRDASEIDAYIFILSHKVLCCDIFIEL